MPICTRLLRKSRHSLRSALCLSAKLPTQAWSCPPSWDFFGLAYICTLTPRNPQDRVPENVFAKNFLG
ncbi:hypothetical protein MOX91_01095 [Opitutales bacterium CLA-KB-P66]|uniref:Uncharacterized protein n=1 Tax=Intestinicryptomonas porci TaxID=2926320 RepID=A0ABU4WDZ7_9BACT|nr:hypothetical protein [Opitutales bacterium CLA-KB-P66]